MSPGRRRRVLAVAAAAWLAGVVGVGAAENVRTIPSRPGVTQSFLLVHPPDQPVAAAVFFAGGNGALRLGSGRVGLAGNFLVRTRARFAEHGLLVAVVDAPSDHPAGLDGFRTTAAHATDVQAVIAALRAEAAVPVWVVGTSMGTVSAANAAARLTTGGPDGLVLTSSVTRQGRERSETVGDVRLKDVRVPTLVVHHRQDACRVTPYADTVALLRDFSAVPRRQLFRSTGARRRSRGRATPARPMGTSGSRPRW